MPFPATFSHLFSSFLTTSLSFVFVFLFFFFFFFFFFFSVFFFYVFFSSTFFFSFPVPPPPLYFQTSYTLRNDGCGRLGSERSEGVAVGQGKRPLTYSFTYSLPVNR
ncbi:hypothetical protein E3T35_13900 [Cryobacterium sp. TMT1-2-2]|nr:hypothetical protein E3T35_13900 [Cryobacterium sp. TMT1-2-2]